MPIASGMRDMGRGRWLQGFKPRFAKDRARGLDRALAATIVWLGKGLPG